MTVTVVLPSNNTDRRAYTTNGTKVYDQDGKEIEDVMGVCVNADVNSVLTATITVPIERVRHADD